MNTRCMCVWPASPASPASSASYPPAGSVRTPYVIVRGKRFALRFGSVDATDATDASRRHVRGRARETDGSRVRGGGSGGGGELVHSHNEPLGGGAFRMRLVRMDALRRRNHGGRLRQRQQVPHGVAVIVRMHRLCRWSRRPGKNVLGRRRKVRMALRRRHQTLLTLRQAVGDGVQ